MQILNLFKKHKTKILFTLTIVVLCAVVFASYIAFESQRFNTKLTAELSNLKSEKSNSEKKEVDRKISYNEILNDPTQIVVGSKLGDFVSQGNYKDIYGSDVRYITLSGTTTVKGKFEVGYFNDDGIFFRVDSNDVFKMPVFKVNCENTCSSFFSVRKNKNIDLSKLDFSKEYIIEIADYSLLIADIGASDYATLVRIVK